MFHGLFGVSSPLAIIFPSQDVSKRRKGWVERTGSRGSFAVRSRCGVDAEAEAAIVLEIGQAFKE